MASDKAIAAYRSARAVEMRLQGEQYSEIAKELEYADRSGAWRAVDRALRARTDRAVAEFHRQRLARIDQQLDALQIAAERGNLGAIDQMLVLIQERYRLMYVGKTVVRV